MQAKGRMTTKTAAMATDEKTSTTWSRHRIHTRQARAKHDDDVVPGSSSSAGVGDMGLEGRETLDAIAYFFLIRECSL